MNDPRLTRHPLGFLEVVDKPSSQELASYYAQTYYQAEQGNYRKSYSPEELRVIQLRIAQRWDQASALLGHERPGRLLDVGCGEGFVLKAFADKDWEITGIDFSSAGVKGMNPEVADRVEQGDTFALLEAQITKGERYNLVWLGNVLEHVLDPLGLMTSLRRLVTPRGLLIVTVPNDGNAYHESLYESGDIDRRFWIATPDHMSYFTASSLRATAEAVGWDCLALQGDFPIDIFLAHEDSNYVANQSRGPAAHRARLLIEGLIGEAGPSAANRFYAALAEVGLGRNLTAFYAQKPKDLRHEPEEHLPHFLSLYPFTVKPGNALRGYHLNRGRIAGDGWGPYACMKRPAIAAEEFALAAVEPKHIETIRLWRCAQLGVLRQSNPISPEEQEAYYAEHIWPQKAMAKPENILLIYLQRGRPIGYGGLVHIAWEHRRAEVSFLLDPEMEREPERRAQLFLAYLSLIQNLAFQYLGLERLFTETYATRETHIRTLELAGFQCEGRLRAHVRIDGEAIDSVFHGCLAIEKGKIGV